MKEGDGMAFLSKWKEASGILVERERGRQMCVKDEEAPFRALYEV